MTSAIGCTEFSLGTVKEVLETRWEAAGRPAEGWIWPAPTKSDHIDHSTLKKQHRRALRLSGVRSFVLYSLRHSFATRIAPHVDAWTLCKIMGWSSLSVAMTYIHPSEDRVLDAFSGMGGQNLGTPMLARNCPPSLRSWKLL
jgi:integrase